MGTRILATDRYQRQIGRLLPATERATMEEGIAESPDEHPVIPGTGGVRKARWSRPGVGKRGGLRVIFFRVVDPATIVFLGAYAKSKQENITEREKRSLKAEAQELEQQIRDQQRKRGDFR
ncbi:MAG: type II toxin-antitoxin system RelE/ParE family toxin [Bryobacterales bacterium]|nr:type II toxin-antitoxin system RelE/ParE family toxin [Bryobacterales bacterium]